MAQFDPIAYIHPWVRADELAIIAAYLGEPLPGAPRRPVGSPYDAAIDDVKAKLAILETMLRNLERLRDGSFMEGNAPPFVMPRRRSG